MPSARRTCLLVGSLSVALFGLAGCGEDGGAAGGAPVAGDGKSDSPRRSKMECLFQATNTATADAMAGAGVPAAAIRAILAYRSGPDGQPGSADDRTIASLDELDGIPGVGPVTIERLGELGRSLNACGAAPLPPRPPLPEPAPPPTPTGPRLGIDNINWVTTTTRRADGDLVSLRIRDESDFIRVRCYGAGCAQAVAETQRLRVYDASSGKRYLDFMSYEHRALAGGDFDDHPVLADSYELAVVSATRIKLRKTRTSVWRTLVATSDQALCTSTGGRWGTSASGSTAFERCDCGGTSMGWGGRGYIGGAGCVDFPAVEETSCDDTGGTWTDDDATPLGTYCTCPLGQRLELDGCTDL